MSEPMLISPMLDGFVMGDPISDHDGVRCCPAMQVESEKKYIVKIISVPASQVKLDALLLAGAFSDRSSALEYFKDLSQDVVEEAVLLQRLARLEGFTPFENWQVVPMENATGYDVYLLGPYRHTLERHLRRSPMTHLGAVNLGLDICAALASCRRSGYLYVDLKPDNIFIFDEREYRIGDLGFISLASLPYASLPDKYHSAYTAPEITDAYSALNDTMDIYAAGLVLYQVYNNGVLPFEGKAPAEALPPPEHADYEMAEIILKACAPKPEDRWQDPSQMGQALVNYMQRNGANDTPIVPPAVPIEEASAPETAEELPSEEPSTEEILAEVDEALDAVSYAEETDETAQAPAKAEMLTESETVPETEEPQSDDEQESQDPETDSPSEDEIPVVAAPAVEDETPSAEEDAPVSGEGSSVEEEPVPVPQETPAEEPSTNGSGDDYNSDEVSRMLAQADELIAHETPEPVVAPAPIDVPIPPRIQPEAAPEETEPAPETTVEEIPAKEPETAAQVPDEPEETDEASEEDTPPAEKPRRKGWVTALVCLLLAAALFVGGWFFYTHYYQQTILGIALNGEEDRLTVTLNSQIDDELLTVVCTDPYGNAKREPVVDGVASFSGLTPDTRYKIHVEIYGFHQLIGMTTGVHVTADQSTIVGFHAATGTENGSVILNFTVEGEDTSEWMVTCSAEGEEDRTVTFTGHMVTVTGLTVGKTYSFHLEPVASLYIVGETTVEYTASNLIYAENLAIQGFTDNALIATWTAPADTVVESWSVRCYNDMGYDKTIVVEDTTAVFEDLDSTMGYTVEVTVTGMTLGCRDFVSANSVTIQQIQVDDSNRNQLTVSWDYEGNTPESGWLLMYTVTGDDEQKVVQCSKNSGVISPLIPGATYTFTIQCAGGNTVFGGSYEYQASEAETFTGYWISAKHIAFKMCHTPNVANWDHSDVDKDDYTTAFHVGESASFTIVLNHEYNTSSDKITTLFLIRDAEGNIVSNATQTQTWTSMWYRGNGKCTIPTMPETAGSYTVYIYYNGAFVTSQEFTVTQAEE